LFLPDTADAPKLHSHLNNSQFLDAISAPSSGKGGKKKAAKRTAEDLIEISDDSDEEEDGEPVVS
jgi:DNA-directed RNA polymerase-3 subunit RPC5|tara:strand:+ start:5801 stop:5995 length:195 start_codon:yes stop_codon:yes gene_type:complete